MIWSHCWRTRPSGLPESMLRAKTCHPRGAAFPRPDALSGPPAERGDS
jgi:hypothetical protein